MVYQAMQKEILEWYVYLSFVFAKSAQKTELPPEG